MQDRGRVWLFVFTCVLGSTASVRGADELPPMRFNEVREVAPGVFFRYSSISATDKTVPFGGSNNIWVVFGDYVVVIDANFPKEAGDVIAAIKKTTDRPIRYVFDTHYHGDHADGNPVFHLVNVVDDITMVFVSRPCPHTGRRLRLLAEAQDALHGRRLRERRLQLHGAFRLSLMDSDPGACPAARYQDGPSWTRSDRREGSSGKAETLLSRTPAAGETGHRIRQEH